MAFLKVVLGAIGYINEYKRPLVKALIVPFVVCAFLDFVAQLDIYVSGLKLPAAIALSIISVMVQTIFAVTTHRIVLLGPGSVPEWGLKKWTVRETIFTVHVIGLWLIGQIILFVGFRSIESVILVLALMFWALARLSLVFPGIATDKGVSFKLSWRLTKSHQLLMFLVVTVIPAISCLPPIMVTQVLHVPILKSFLTSIATVFVVASLSVSYRYIYQATYER